MAAGISAASLPPWRRSAVVGLLCVHAALLAWAATRHSPTIDEAAHLPAGISHWVLGRYELYAVNPPLVRSIAALPVLCCRPELDWTRMEPNIAARSEFQVGRDFINANGTRSFQLYTIGRWACIPFSLLGGWICCRWATELFGWRSGLMALSLWCFSPTILANGQLLTPDLAATSLGVAACWRFRSWLRQPNWISALVAGVTLGAAQGAKFTWIVLFGLWPALWLIRRQTWSARWGRGGTADQTAQLAGILMIAIYVINTCYGFDGSFQRLGNSTFVSQALRGTSDHGNRFRDTPLACIPVPLPRDYVLGIDVQKRDFENKMRSYLLGEWRDSGWWYYYLVALGVKVPLGMWCLVCVSLFAWQARQQSGWYEHAFLLAPAMSVFVLVSSQTGFNHHMRYVLPIFPFVMIWTSQVAE